MHAAYGHLSPQSLRTKVVSLQVIMSTPTQVSYMAFRLRAHDSLVGLAACLGFCALALLPWGPWDETQADEEVIPGAEGSATVFCQPALEWLRIRVETPARH
jgi:hypothetical protein